MSYLLEDMEKWAGDRETDRLTKEELNRKIDSRKHMLWHDTQDIKEGMMPPKEKIKPKFQAMKKGPFTSFTEDSDSHEKYLKKSNERMRRRHDFIMEKHRKINQAKYDAWGKENEAMRDSFERDLKKEKRNQLIKPIALTGAGLVAIGGGAYLYNHYKKKKRAQAEQEKTAAPMFGKNRYIPRTPRDDFERARSRLVMVDGMAKDKFPGYVPSRDLPRHNVLKEEFEKARKSNEDYDKKNKKLPSRIMQEKLNLKQRYHYSKQENIERDKREREEDVFAKNRLREYNLLARRRGYITDDEEAIRNLFERS